MINIEIKIRTAEPDAKTMITENVYISAPLTADECRRCRHELEMCLGIVNSALRSFEGDEKEISE